MSTDTGGDSFEIREAFNERGGALIPGFILTRKVGERSYLINQRLVLSANLSLVLSVSLARAPASNPIKLTLSSALSFHAAEEKGA